MMIYCGWLYNTPWSRGVHPYIQYAFICNIANASDTQLVKYTRSPKMSDTVQFHRNPGVRGELYILCIVYIVIQKSYIAIGNTFLQKSNLHNYKVTCSNQWNLLSAVDLSESWLTA